MKEVFRYEGNRDYWDRRWRETERDPGRFRDLDIYPIKYAEMVMGDPEAEAVELGAGLGRVVKHYAAAGRRIAGVERSPVAVDRLKRENPELAVIEADVLDLPYEDSRFDVLLAFGLYHNLERDMECALAETARVLRPGGRFCISMRPNNIEMHVNEWYWLWRNRKLWGNDRAFHKWLVGSREFARVLADHGLRTEEVHRARNVSLLYRIAALRATAPDETARRGAGYKLNRVGRALDKLLVTVAPGQFCNVLVFIGRKGL